MQKVYNVLSVIAILGLAGWVWFLSKKTSTLEDTIAKLTPPTPPATPDPKRTSISGSELWDAVQSKVQDMKIDLTFKNQ